MTGNSPAENEQFFRRSEIVFLNFAALLDFNHKRNERNERNIIR